MASAFLREISSVIALADVQIHWELTPRGELISSEQKKRASKRPSFDFRQGPVVQLRAHVIGDIEENWVFIVGYILSQNQVQRCAVIDDDRNELQDIDRDQLAICIISLVR